uniref:Uncharacterized protein n=1 Tax=Cacopsylla melanoneura TaxID=428564 RepID=A0A8D9BKB9_9HEMI
MQMKVPKVMRPVPQCMKIHQVVYCHEKRKMILRKISCTTCCSSQLDTCEKCQLEGVPAILLLLHIQCYKSPGTEISTRNPIFIGILKIMLVCSLSQITRLWTRLSLG